MSGNVLHDADRERLDLPPHSVEVEGAVLGSVLLSSSCFDVIEAAGIKPSAFYDLANERIFRAMQELRREGTAIDCITLSQRLREIPNAISKLEALVNAVPTVVALDGYLADLKKLALRREIIRLGVELTLGSNTTIYGSHGATIKQTVANTQIFRATTAITNLVISGIRLLGLGSDYINDVSAGRGISIVPSSGTASSILIENCVVENQLSEGRFVALTRVTNQQLSIRCQFLLYSTRRGPKPHKKRRLLTMRAVGQVAVCLQNGHFSFAVFTSEATL